MRKRDMVIDVTPTRPEPPPLGTECLVVGIDPAKEGHMIEARLVLTEDGWTVVACRSIPRVPPKANDWVVDQLGRGHTS